MDFEDHWPVTEKALAREAASLGQVLERLHGRIPPALIGEREWERVLERADPLPPAMAAFPFGFELPLHSSLPTADLGVSVVGGGRTAAFFEEAARSEDADQAARGVARLLAETKPEDSRLRRVAGRKMLLEYDIDATGQGAHPDPGLFLYPAEGVLLGDRSRDRLGDLQVVVEAIAAATGRDLAEGVLLGDRSRDRLGDLQVVVEAIAAATGRDLDADGLADREKLSALAEDWSGMETLIGNTGSFVHVRGLHHIKLSIVGERIEQVKAYIFLLLLGV